MRANIQQPPFGQNTSESQNRSERRPTGCTGRNSLPEVIFRPLCNVNQHGLSWFASFRLSAPPPGTESQNCFCLRHKCLDRRVPASQPQPAVTRCLHDSSTGSISLDGNSGEGWMVCSAFLSSVSTRSFLPVLWLRSWLGKSLLVISRRMRCPA